MNAQTEQAISYDTTQYHTKRAFIEQAMDPSATIRDAVRSGEWTLHNASEEAADYIHYIIDLDSDREALASMEIGEDAERLAAKLDGTLTVEDLESYILDLIVEAAPAGCDRCGDTSFSDDQLIPQPNGQRICGACIFTGEQTRS